MGRDAVWLLEGKSDVDGDGWRWKAGQRAAGRSGARCPMYDGEQRGVNVSKFIYYGVYFLSVPADPGDGRATNVDFVHQWASTAPVY